MDRRKFFKAGTLAGVGAALLNPLQGFAHPIENEINYKNKKAKNIIVLVSDGMSSGTLNMANIYSERILGRTTNWIQAYKDNIFSRGLMDMASASSIVTDSAAASSSWGSGERVKNGVINISVNGEQLLPIWQESDSEQQPGVVLKELQKGYKLKDRVLRPSMVSVNE